jgi:hypothetical protein
MHARVTGIASLRLAKEASGRKSKSVSDKIRAKTAYEADGQADAKGVQSDT